MPRSNDVSFFQEIEREKIESETKIERERERERDRERERKRPSGTRGYYLPQKSSVSKVS